MASEMASERIGMEQLLESVAALDAEELVLIIEAASTRLKKVGTKSLSKGKRVSTGKTPSQLQHNNEWVNFIKEDARLNGWEAFEAKKTVTDKVTGKKTEWMVEMAGSVEREDGMHVFSDTGALFEHANAMSYSKILKDRNDPLYQQFLEAFMEQVGEVVTLKKEVRKISAAEAAAEKKRKDEEKAMEKAAEKAQKESEKARVKAEKDAEKEAEKARKDAEKAAKAKPVVQKAVPLVQPVKRLPSPAPVPVDAAAALPSASPVATVVKKMPGAPVKVKAVDTFKCKEHDVVQWVWKGETYLRDWRNFVWREEDGVIGDFQGVYIFAKDVIEEAEEPVYDEPVDEPVDE
jgi:hypothetical protein